MQRFFDSIGVVGALIFVFLGALWVVFPLFVMGKLNALITEQQKTNSLLTSVESRLRGDETPKSKPVEIDESFGIPSSVILGGLAVVAVALSIFYLSKS